MLYQKGATVFAEIHDQPRLWTQVLDHLEPRKGELGQWARAQNFGQVVYIGSGPSYSTCLVAARITHLVTGLNSVALPAGEILYCRRLPPYDPRIKTLVVAVSRSAETTETVWALEKLRQLDPRCTALAITARPGPLAQFAHQHLLLEGVDEAGPVATRSQTASLLAAMVLVSWLSGKDALFNELRRLPDMLDYKRLQQVLQPVASTKPQHVVVLGSGAYYGAAAQGALLVRQMAHVPAEYQYFLEYRHGSQCALTNQVLVVGLMSDTYRAGEEQTIIELGAMRAPRMAITGGQADERLNMLTEYTLQLQAQVSEVSRVLLTLPPLQLLAFYMALAKGTNPDKPKGLSGVVTLKEKPGT
jgi:glucosamine--fructose-6-phosphate aminotransferase (isomerizing)